MKRPKQQSQPDYGELARTARFEATIDKPPKTRGDDWVNELDIDRLPDRDGHVRALVTAADCLRLLERGFAVHLTRAHRLQPLDPKLVMSDETFQRWLDKRLKPLKRKR